MTPEDEKKFIKEYKKKLGKDLADEEKLLKWQSKEVSEQEVSGRLGKFINFRKQNRDYFNSTADKRAAILKAAGYEEDNYEEMSFKMTVTRDN